MRCSSCGYPQQPETYASAGFSVCPHCNARLLITVFPALYSQDPADGFGPLAAAEDAATCFYHPTRPAVVPCGSCGRYLCKLCEIEMGAETICPNCMDRAARNEEVTELVDSRTMYDSIALTVAAAPVLFWIITIFTAPVSIYMTIRHWRTPLSILPRVRWRFVLAFLIAGVQISGWTVLLFSLIT